MARFLIVNADDYGLTPGVSQGILQAHREGILTSTTFMTNLPWAAEAAAMLAGAPDLGVGIHLNLTTGSPLLPPVQVPSLVSREGSFCRSGLRIVTRVRPDEAEAEWTAQVERGIDLLGRLPTHLDTHRFLQVYPPLCEVMLRVAKRFGIRAVRLLEPEFLPPGSFAPWSPARFLVGRALRRSSALIRESGLAHPAATLAGDFGLERLLHLLDRLEEGVTELICHPGLVDERLYGISSLREQRTVELAALTAPAARRRVAERGIQLLHFGALGS